MTTTTTVERYLALMQTGSHGLDELVALFTEDAVYVEPFSGTPVQHRGKAEIRDFFANALEQHLKGAVLSLERLDVDGERVRAEWTCAVPMFPGPLRGFDLVTLDGDRIARLETTVTEFPAPHA